MAPNFRMKRRLLSIFSLLCCGPGFVGQAWAFPPAPYYTLYGMVRDQVGQTVTAEGAEVILLKGGVEIGRTPVAAGGLFSLVVSMNGALFYPIEVSGNLTAGKGGERVKLDLTLGEDLDKDGLPDT
jgi:hypothetical protein